MRVLFLTSGRRLPSTRFRILAYLPALRGAGLRCAVRHSHPPKYAHWNWLGWRLSLRARRALRRINLQEAAVRRFDLAVVERELFDDDSAEFEQRLRRIVPRMLLDVDDAVFLRHPAKYSSLATMCDGVIAGNDAIAEHTRALNPAVAVIPTSVDLARYQRSSVPPQPGPIVLGWTGTSSNLEHLRLIARPLRRLAENHDLRLHIVADSREPLRTIDFGKLPVRFDRWSLRKEMQQLAPFQIGLMPLADSEWERYKCGLKLIQYLALGIPAVASPVGVNTHIVKAGVNGLLAGNEAEWEDALLALVTDAELRARLGGAGRQIVTERYSIQANAPKMEQALRDLGRSPAT